MGKWACTYDSQDWIQPVVTSYLVYILKQLHLNTAKACISLRDVHVLFRSSVMYGELLQQISRQASPLLPLLWIFHLRWCLIWLFLSSWISSPWRSQVVISRAAPPPPPPPQPPQPHYPPPGFVMFDPGPGRPARHSVQTLAPFPQCTMHSSSLLRGLEEIMQPGEL